MSRIFKSRFTRIVRRDLLIFKMKVANITIFSCSHCFSRDLLCVASQDSIKCIECVRFDVNCDLIMFVENFKNLLIERKRVRIRFATCLQETFDFQTSIIRLNDEIIAMFDRETSNINNLKSLSSLNFSTSSIVVFATLDFLVLFEFEFFALFEKCALLQFDLNFFDEIDSVMFDNTSDSF